jgi:putative oxidoreductase
MARDEPSVEQAGPADLGLLVLRLAIGGLLAGHGAQKLFGWFGGHGLAGTGAFMESIGFRPGKEWAALAGLSEFGGGTLTALGLLHPIGPIGTLGAMFVAAVNVHGGKPIWATQGGAELPVINMSAATALALIGPGAFSLDRAFGLRVPKPLAALAALGVVGGVVLAETRPQPAPAPGSGQAGSQPEANSG